MRKIFPVLEYFNVPNFITTLGMIFGIAACYFLLQGDLQGAIICLSFSMFMDLCDGFFADKLDQQTEFGQYVDSLVDFFICCIIPILLVYIFVGSHLFLMISLGFYCICWLWRLAYYNVIESDGYFVGLPVPGAMLMVSMTTWTVVNHNAPTWVLYLTLFCTGLLMISFVKLQKYGLWQKSLWGIGLLFLGFIFFW